MTKVYGLRPSDEQHPDMVLPDTKTTGQKFGAFIRTEGVAFVCAGMGLMMFFAVSISDFLFFIALFLYFISRNKVKTYPYETPMDEKILEGRKKGKRGDGMFFIGNDIETGAATWFSDDNVRTHWLVMGSTGSGKTRFLLGVLYQALLTGSSALYVDGKADNTVFWLVYSICRRLGREDDLLVINYLTGGDNQSNKPYIEREFLSNTTNPFAYGQPDNLRSMVVGLMRDDGGDGMWKGRASALLGALLKCLCYMRDEGMLQLSVVTLREYLTLDKILQVCYKRNDIPMRAKRPLFGYLAELPGFTAEDAKAEDINPKCYEQHGYLQMQLTESLADMAETYGSIFSTPMGEVDFKDVVFNRRILFVMLPSLEKDPDSLANLGKMVVSGVRSALAPALGNKVQGHKREVIDVKPTTAKAPFYLIMDEYGYYSVKGFAVVAAQARSLGVSCVFAGQDYPSFKKGGEEEAASTVANTNIKICLKLEDPKETYELFEKRAGLGNVASLSGYEMKDGSDKFSKNRNTGIDKKERINVRDLVSQGPGEAHIIFGDTLVRARLFYADPHQVEQARLNRFIVCLPPSEAKIAKYKELCNGIEKLDAKNVSMDKERQGENNFNLLLSDLKYAAKKIGSAKACIYAICNNTLRIHKPEIYSDSEDDEGAINSPTMEELDHMMMPSEMDFKRLAKEANESKAGALPNYQLRDRDSQKEKEKQQASNRGVDLSQEIEFMDDPVDPVEISSSMRMSAKAYTSLLSKALDNMVVDGVEAKLGHPLSEEDKRKVSVNEQLYSREKDLGSSEQASRYEAARGTQQVVSNLNYPADPIPNKPSEETMSNNISELESRLKALKTGVL